jgi:molybdate transport system substrate-binding protein
VVLNFGASDVLMQQIVKGAPADVFASADQNAMDKAEAEKVVQAATRKDFAANAIVLIVPRQPLGIATPKDLTRADVKRIAYGNPASVPVGRYTRARWSAGPVGRRGRQGRAGAERAPGARLRGARRSRRRLRVRHRRRVMPDKVKVAARVPTTTPVTYPIAVTAQRSRQQANAFVQYAVGRRPGHAGVGFETLS